MFIFSLPAWKCIQLICVLHFEVQKQKLHYYKLLIYSTIIHAKQIMRRICLSLWTFHKCFWHHVFEPIAVGRIPLMLLNLKCHYLNVFLRQDTVKYFTVTLTPNRRAANPPKRALFKEFNAPPPTHPTHLVCNDHLIANFLSFHMSLVVVMNCGAGNTLRGFEISMFYFFLKLFLYTYPKIYCHFGH